MYNAANVFGCFTRKHWFTATEANLSRNVFHQNMPSI